MSNETLISYFKFIGWTVEVMKGQDGLDYIVIRGYEIKVGVLASIICDLAIQWSNSIPYTTPPAIHTKPALVPMDMSVYRTQSSGVGNEWQYWSRVFNKAAQTPQAYVAHISTIFNEVKL